MSPAEKLKRVKLISEKLYIENYMGDYINPGDCIGAALKFVEEFENFEDGYLKDNPEIVSGRPKPLGEPKDENK